MITIYDKVLLIIRLRKTCNNELLQAQQTVYIEEDTITINL